MLKNLQINDGSRWLLLVGLLLLSQQLYAQDLEKLKDLKKVSVKKMLKGKGIKLTGTVSANNVYYNSGSLDGGLTPNRNAPFTMVYTGNLTLDILGKIRMPIAFSFSNQNINFSHPFDQNYRFAQPFNRFVLKPTYKGFTLQIGTCAMTFSPYTLAGHRYDGIGLQYKSPKKPFYFGFMWGNLQRAVRIDTTFSTLNNQPSYKQTGVGVQVGYHKKEDKIELIFFTASDKLTSLPYTLDALNILPQQNSVVSLKGEKAFARKWLWQNEIAVSGITNDTRAIEGTRSTNLFNTFFWTFTPKTSTNYKKALKTSLLYRGKTFNAGVEYSRVDPNYKTLGAYYFANDLETFSGKLASRFLENKLNISGNIGWQQDNVQSQKLKTLKRLVGAATINFLPNDKVNVLLNYSNFTSFSNLRSVYDYLKQVTPYNVLDTLNYRQINQNLMGNVNVLLPASSPDVVQSLAINAILQRGADTQGGMEIRNDLSNYILDYGYTLKPKQLSLTGSLYYSTSNIGGIRATDWGPSMGINKGFGQVWRTHANITYTWGTMSGVAEKLTNIRLGATGTINKQVHLNVNLIYLNRRVESIDRYIPSFREFTATLGLVYNFTIFSIHGK